ncbi:uncharacterized protein [Nerophis lumbriciformis]|uniref:uncharacterized protein n=1 Tax=Nerophis lumbriciformis TaxID=546530 RepID=UPI002ADFDF69|nr:uncharacterized protein LOC133608309 [Nerophis lumbriciformis]
MDGQGDGDHNGPNRHHIHIPTEDHPPNGDNNDMEFIFLLHFIINHHMRVFRQNQIGFINENIVNVNILHHGDNMNNIVEHEDEVDSDEANVEMQVNRVMEDEDEEEEPQPGPSRYRREQEDDTRNRKRSSWWHEFDNNSDSSVDLDNEEDPLFGRCEERSRDELDSDDTALHFDHELAKNSDVAEEGSTQGAMFNCLPEPSGINSINKGGHRRRSRGNTCFQQWDEVEGNSSDCDTYFDVMEEENPKMKSRDNIDSEEEEENYFKWQDNIPAMPNCSHGPTLSIRDTDMAEEDERSSAQETEEHSTPGPSRMR